MNKVLVKLFLPKINKQYDVWIPINRTIYSVIKLLLKGINELNEDKYQPKEMPILYNRESGKKYDVNDWVQNTDIKNGTELILI